MTKDTNRKIIVRLKDGAFTYKELSEKFGVSPQYIAALDASGDLERRIEAGDLGKNKLPNIEPGSDFGTFTVVCRADNIRGYKAYLVRDKVTGREAVVKGTDLLSGRFTGAGLRGAVIFPKGHKLKALFLRYFRHSTEFKSAEDFSNWAAEAGYSKEHPYPRRYDPTLGYTRNNTYFGPAGEVFIHDGKILNGAGWAKELGVSHQRVNKLRKEGRLEEYIEYRNNAAPGRHRPPANAATNFGVLVDKLCGYRTLRDFANDAGVSYGKLCHLRKQSFSRHPGAEFMQAILAAAADGCSVTIRQLEEAVEKDMRAHFESRMTVKSAQLSPLPEILLQRIKKREAAEGGEFSISSTALKAVLKEYMSKGKKED